ncbi:MAG: MFS transporter [Nitrospira sp.]|nr:MAG: MFS transporter [Nitrospira sp.]
MGHCLRHKSEDAVSHLLFLKWVKVEPEERVPLCWSFVYFFCLLCGYYMLRPVRDEMAIEGGVQHLPWMMTGTFLTLLIATPLFGFLSARLPRARLMLSVYAFFISHLLLFFMAMTAQWHPEWIARAFFIWLSVFNLFVVSVFWSFMADVFSPAQGARLFGVIAAGGSAGAMVGPVMTTGVTYAFSIPVLMLVSAAWLALCGLCIARLDQWAAAHSSHGRTVSRVPLGGSMWAGIRAVAASPYLLGICAYLFLLTMSATVLYMEQTALVGREIPSPETRTRLFAGLDLTVNVLTFIMQVWVTNRLVLRFGLGAALMVLPVVTAVGFAAIVMNPVLAVFLSLTVARRVGEYAIAKPAREVLFTVLPREDKYKAKNFIDTAVSRGGDASTGWLVSGAKALGATTGIMAAALVPVMMLWGWIGWRLGREEAALQRSDRTQRIKFLL